jgi:hypothetical protein
MANPTIKPISRQISPEITIPTSMSGPPSRPGNLPGPMTTECHAHGTEAVTALTTWGRRETGSVLVLNQHRNEGGDSRET